MRKADRGGEQKAVSVVYNWAAAMIWGLEGRKPGRN